MTPDEALLDGLEQFGEVLKGTTDADWTASTPCEQWTVRELVGHVLGVTDSALASLRGEEYDWSVKRDAAQRAAGDPQQSFATNAEQIRAELLSAQLDAVQDTPMGPMTVAQRISFPAADLPLHAWDLGQAIGVPVSFDEATIAFAHSVLDPIPDEMKRSSGVFGPEIAPSANATASEEFVAWTGRTPK